MIGNYDHMSFTSDIWTDTSSGASLLSLTCHGISDKFERSSIVLKCETFDDRHTGDIIAEKFKTMPAEWNISTEKVHCIVRDEGSNMKRGMRLVLLDDLDCTVHKMQIAIRHGFQSQENIKDVKEKCKKISTHFNHSTIAQKQLEKIQDRLNQPHLKVFQDCETRWNSTEYMFERFTKIKDALSLYTNDNKIESIFPEEWKVIECCLELLKPFEEATHEMSSSQALISSVIPIIQMLLKKLDDYLAKPTETDPIQLAASILKTQFSAKFSSLEDSNLFAIATYLDPRYKHKFFKPVTEEKIKDAILKIVNDPVSTGSPESSPSWETSKRRRLEDALDPEPGTSGMGNKSGFKSDLAMMLDSSSEDEGEGEPDDSSPDIFLRKELVMYRNKKRLDLDENPLNWWKVN
ncbi:zinc finger BED domain-containing protein 4-like [Belonocnema kinseyi]|uniref:zinc finger BED domain-containing protein 4-like n=1 Tax=Belonocnema kinseyi TaxID=2817044 RepID=UPI00143DEE84|nr:zinc finger BED domain-containing protein 4-like [Belonocnema kinseyi]